MRSDGGFTLQFRRLWNHPVFQSKQEAAVFSWMKDAAAWRRTTVHIAGGAVALERGQLIITERGIAEDFGLLRSQVRSLIRRLIDDHMVTKVRAMCGRAMRTILTIVKYDQYQGDKARSGGSENHPETPVDNHVPPKVSPSPANRANDSNDLQAPKKGEATGRIPISEEPESVAARVCEPDPPELADDPEPASVAVFVCEDDPQPQPSEPEAPVEEEQVFSKIDVGPEEQRCAPPEEPAYDHKAWLRKLRRDQLGQKLQRFMLATMREADRTKAMLGMMGCDRDHDEKWWFERVEDMRKRAHWDDKREGNYAHTKAMRAVGACV